MMAERNAAGQFTGAGDKPPKGTKARKPSKAAQVSYAAIEQGVTDFLAGVGLVVSMGDPHCGQILLSRAPDVAGAWTNLAHQSSTVKRVLGAFVGTSAWAGAIGVTGAVAIPILAHHGLAPEHLASMFQAGASIVEGDGNPTLVGIPTDVDVAPGGARDVGGANRSG